MLIKLQKPFRIFFGLCLPLVGSKLQAGETYEFDASHSTIAFTAHQFVGATHGKFTKFKGRIEIDRDHPERSSVTVKIDVASVNTGIAKRDDHLRSADFFDVARYPEIIFRSHGVKQTGTDTGDIVGDLMMHGVTRSIILHVRLVSPASAEASRTRWAVTTDSLKRRDFGLLFGAATEAVSGISQNVAVNIAIEATRDQ
jgi:polyisoprenoid-binding protein YceI